MDHRTPRATPAPSAVAAGLAGSTAGGLLESVAPAGGMWPFLLSLITVGLAQVAGRMRSSSARHRASPGPAHFPMAPMGCATLGGLAGGVLAYIAGHALAGLQGAHGLTDAQSLHSATDAGLVHLQVLSMYLMNGGMGAMLGASVGDCPWRWVPRSRAVGLRLPRIAWIRL